MAAAKSTQKCSFPPWFGLVEVWRFSGPFWLTGFNQPWSPAENCFNRSSYPDYTITSRNKTISINEWKKKHTYEIFSPFIFKLFWLKSTNSHGQQLKMHFNKIKSYIIHVFFILVKGSEMWIWTSVFQPESYFRLKCLFKSMNYDKMQSHNQVIVISANHPVRQRCHDPVLRAGNLHLWRSQCLLTKYRSIRRSKLCALTYKHYFTIYIY